MQDFTLFENITEQLGGLGKLQAMVGAHGFAKGENYIQFRFKGNRTMNTCKIILNGRDEYDVEFWKCTASKAKKIETADAWAGNLKKVFEDHTGLYLTF